MFMTLVGADGSCGLLGSGCRSWREVSAVLFWLASFRVRAIARSSMQLVNYLTLIDQQLRGEHIRDIEVAV
jgi:hypothetical protein